MVLMVINYPDNPDSKLSDTGFRIVGKKVGIQIIRTFTTIRIQTLIPMIPPPTMNHLKIKFSSHLAVCPYFRSALLRIRNAYATTRSHPLTTCDSTAPSPYSLASVSKMKSLLKSGKISIWGWTQEELSNASAHSDVHLKSLPFSVKRYKGFAIPAKFLTYRL